MPSSRFSYKTERAAAYGGLIAFRLIRMTDFALSDLLWKDDVSRSSEAEGDTGT